MNTYPVTPIPSDPPAIFNLPKPTFQAPVQLDHDFWTTDETASFLRCEPQTIRKAISRNGSYWGLKPYRFGRRLYFRSSDVRALIEGE